MEWLVHQSNKNLWTRKRGCKISTDVNYQLGKWNSASVHLTTTSDRRLPPSVKWNNCLPLYHLNRVWLLCPGGKHNNSKLHTIQCCSAHSLSINNSLSDWVVIFRENQQFRAKTNGVFPSTLQQYKGIQFKLLWDTIWKTPFHNLSSCSPNKGHWNAGTQRTSLVPGARGGVLQGAHTEDPGPLCAAEHISAWAFSTERILGEGVEHRPIH